MFPLSVSASNISLHSPSSKRPSQPKGLVLDKNLRVAYVATESPSFIIPYDPQHSPTSIPPTNVSAVSLVKNTATFDDIVLNVQNLEYNEPDIHIDRVALKLTSILIMPHPLRIWTPGISETYEGHFYPVVYANQPVGQLLNTTPSDEVILASGNANQIGETDTIILQIMSTEVTYLQFQVEVTYQTILDMKEIENTLTLPEQFQVVFSDASNWEKYTRRNGMTVLGS